MVCISGLLLCIRCFWFEAGAFHNWTVHNNTLSGCGDMGDVFVAACAPNWDKNGNPLSSGDPVTVGQPFRDIFITGNRFVQKTPHEAVAIWGSDGLTIADNVVSLIHGEPVVRWTGLAASAALEGSFDGFALQPGGELELHGWVVDTALPATTPSNVSIEVDGHTVTTATANTLRPDLVPVVTSDPHHGFDLRLPNTTEWTSNHTLQVFAIRADGSRVALNGGPMCVNLFREACSFPQDCKCGAAIPSALQVSNSLGCVTENNVCYGKACTVPADGCT